MKGKLNLMIGSLAVALASVSGAIAFAFAPSDLEVNGAGTIQNLVGAVFTWNDSIFEDYFSLNYTFAFRSGTSSFALWTGLYGYVPPRADNPTIQYVADSSYTSIYVSGSWVSSEYKVFTVLSNPDGSVGNAPNDLYSGLSAYGTWDLSAIDDPYEVPSTSSSASSSVPTYSEGYSEGYSAGYSDGASEGSSAGYSNGYADGESVGSSAGYENGVADGYASGEAAGYSDGYGVGASEGYSQGYADGYNAGALDNDILVDRANWSAVSGVNTRYDDYFDGIRSSNDSWFHVTSLSAVYNYDYRSLSFDVDVPAFSHALPTTYDSFTIMYRFCSDLSGNVSLYGLVYPVGSYTTYRYDFSISYVYDASASSFSGYFDYSSDILAMGSPNVCYYFSPIVVNSSYIVPSNRLCVSHVRTLLFTKTGVTSRPASLPCTLSFMGHWSSSYYVMDGDYYDGYNAGYADGANSAYNSGYVEGNSAGYASGYAQGIEEQGHMIDIWPLLSAVVTMPFTFLSVGLDWTLFAGTPYEFGVSAFFASLLVVLMLWKIVQLVLGFGK